MSVIWEPAFRSTAWVGSNRLLWRFPTRRLEAEPLRDARLGGHQNRKCDGHPGWLVLWRGWMKLQAMLDDYLAARLRKCGKT